MMYHLCWDPKNREFLLKRGYNYCRISQLQDPIEWSHGMPIDEWLQKLDEISSDYIGEFTLDYIQSGAVYTDYPEYFI